MVAQDVLRGGKKQITFIVLRVHTFINAFMGNMLNLYQFEIINQDKFYTLHV